MTERLRAREQREKVLRSIGSAPNASTPMRAGLEVPGEVRPRAGGDAAVASPISGQVLQISPTVTLGTQVPAGAVLAEVLPLSGQANDAATLEVDLTQARADLQLAQAERARVQRLSSSGAVPTRRVQESRDGTAQSLRSISRLPESLFAPDYVYTEYVFDWDPRKAAAKAEKPGVTFEAAMTVFWIPSPWMAPTSPTPRSKPVAFAWDEQWTAEC